MRYPVNQKALPRRRWLPGAPAAGNEKRLDVGLIIKSGDLADPGNVFGQRKEAQDGSDMHDLEKLPPFGYPNLALVFPPDKAAFRNNRNK